MILAFSHPAIVVNDLEKARHFYQEMFGFSVISREGWTNNPDADKATGTPGSDCKGYMMAGHNCFLELFEFASPPQVAPSPQKLGAQEQGIRHLAFYVDDVIKESTRFLALGGQALGQPHQGAVYLRDPFGNIIELCEIPNQNEQPTRLSGVDRLDDFSGT